MAAVDKEKKMKFVCSLNAVQDIAKMTGEPAEQVIQQINTYEDSHGPA